MTLCRRTTRVFVFGHAGTRVPLTLRAGGRGGGGGGGVLPREKLLKQAVYEGMEKLTAAKLLDGADSALKTWWVAEVHVPAGPGSRFWSLVQVVAMLPVQRGSRYSAA